MNSTNTSNSGNSERSLEFDDLTAMVLKSLHRRYEAAKRKRAETRQHDEVQAALRRRVHRQDVVDEWKVGREARPWHKFWRDVRFFGRPERRRQYEAYKRSTFPVELYAFRERHGDDEE
ncbi:hypothetical protein EKO04_009750 [Ascochyta lentis]|uniref:Uncharacterized protein n=1 Tax=Ascochyta lentis TaxID=205686 RepID=A0A8H7MGM6_9PLEO|nr:hypothetical protein EKO04_009750 [Ascochyta lentis]